MLRVNHRRFLQHGERFRCFKNLKFMDPPKKSEGNSYVPPRMKTARINRNQGGAGFQPATDSQDACPTLQSLFDPWANGGLTRRSFLGVSVFAAAFLSGCMTADRNQEVRR